ncbi:MAG TPA: Dabb family protein [Ilumatobacter sp.]
MFRHVVMFKWTDDVDAAHVAAVSAALDGLVAAIPEIRSYRHGPDAGVNSGNYEYVVVGDFDSADDYVVYRDHPAHRAMIADLITGRVAERAAIQYETAG